MKIDDVVEMLHDTRSKIRHLTFPSRPGVYAVFFTGGQAINGVPANANGLVYVGTSTNLAQRDAETHFQSGKSGFSTLRRTLGALLKEPLRLRATPRSPGASRSNTTCYKFDGDGEKRLTAWMTDRLEVGFATVEDDVSTVEQRVIATLQPSLNLTGWDNPYRKHIKALRAGCSSEARSARIAV